MKRAIIATASRADYGIYIPVLEKIKSYSHDKLHGHIIALCGTDYIEIDRWKITEDSTPLENYDWMLVLGDTMPMLKAAIWAAEHNIKVAHIHGGDKTGSIDDKIRPAISCFADFHLPSLQRHAERLLMMGIDEDKIKVVGPLGIYAMKDAEFIPEKELMAKLSLSDKPIILVIQHPVSTEVEQAGEQMRETLQAVSYFTDYQPVMIFPNGEAGSEAITKSMHDFFLYDGKRQNALHFKNLSYLTFLSLLKISSVIVGNSSCGLVEAPLFGVPCVNIGTRQNGRDYAEIYQVDYDAEKIKSIIGIALCSKPQAKNPYLLNVNGPEIIAEVLSEN
jgi:GDP/UDP-N,N'-diacetylbacillosamine 2-epimerase (hydrolysing)